jgi:hypothetical protein
MTQREGYLLVDHRASPGLPPELARRMGVAPGSKFGEVATLTCCHCKTVVIKNPNRQRERGRCPKCNYKYVCDPCAARMHLPDYVHDPADLRAELALRGG